jgi:hypothetical protein
MAIAESPPLILSNDELLEFDGLVASVTGRLTLSAILHAAGSCSASRRFGESNLG